MDARVDREASLRPAEVLRFECHLEIFPRSRIRPKAGAPTSAVMTPMGSTWPGMMMRDIISEAIRNTAPSRAVAATRRARRKPTMKRIARGKTTQTKPIEPHIEIITVVVSAGFSMWDIGLGSEGRKRRKER